MSSNSSETKASITFFWISSYRKLYCKSWDSEEYHLNFYLLFWSLNFSVKLSGPRPFLTVGPTWYSSFFFGEEERESITFFTLSLFVLFIFSISLLNFICLTIKFCYKVLHYDCDFYDGDTCLCHSSGLYVLLLPFLVYRNLLFVLLDVKCSKPFPCLMMLILNSYLIMLLPFLLSVYTYGVIFHMPLFSNLLFLF